MSKKQLNSKLTVLKKNHINSIINNSHYTFLNKNDVIVISSLILNILKNKLSIETNKELCSLLSKLDNRRNYLNKSEKRLLKFCLFLSNKKEIKQADNNINEIISNIKFMNSLKQLNITKVYAIMISIFLQNIFIHNSIA